MEIKKVLNRIYEFNLSNCTLPDKAEVLSNGIDDELSRMLRKVNTNAGLMVQPTGYKKGLVYLKQNKELVNNPEWNPPIIKFNLEILGLKKGSYYRFTIIARNYKKYLRLVDTTDDRFLHAVTNNNDLLINADLTNVMESKEFTGIFKAYSNEVNILLKFGKIAIKNIIIEEVELVSDALDENGDEVIIDGNRSQVMATSVFGLKSEVTPSFQGKWIPLLRMYGKGLNLYYNRTTHEYCIERDNIDDTVHDNLNANYLMVTININKVPNCGFMNYRIKKCSSELSPNTLKSGYILFDFQNSKGETVDVSEGRIAVKIERLI